MLHLLPKQIPSLERMLEDLGNPHPRKLAKALGVSERTVRKWKGQEYAPRPAMLALYWITQWGQNQVHTEAHNEAQLFRGYVTCVREENEKLRAQLRQLGRIGDFGSANDPSAEVIGGFVAPADAQPLTFRSFEGALERVFSAEQPPAKPSSTGKTKTSSTKQPPRLAAWLRSQSLRKAG